MIVLSSMSTKMLDLKFGAMANGRLEMDTRRTLLNEVEYRFVKDFFILMFMAYIIILKMIIVLLILLVSPSMGLDYLIVGDFGWTMNMTNSQLNFDAINSYVGNLTAKGEKIDFFMSMGDNMYLEKEANPSQADVDTIMSVFNRPNLKDLPIFAIRGNHDC